MGNARRSSAGRHRIGWSWRFIGLAALSGLILSVPMMARWRRQAAETDDPDGDWDWLEASEHGHLGRRGDRPKPFAALLATIRRPSLLRLGLHAFATRARGG